MYDMVEAYIMILTAGGMARRILPLIKEIDAVEHANIVAGEYDIIAHVEAETEQALLTLVTDDIQSIEGVGQTRTSIVLG